MDRRLALLEQMLQWRRCVVTPLVATLPTIVASRHAWLQRTGGTHKAEVANVTDIAVTLGAAVDREQALRAAVVAASSSPASPAEIFPFANVDRMPRPCRDFLQSGTGDVHALAKEMVEVHFYDRVCPTFARLCQDYVDERDKAEDEYCGSEYWRERYRYKNGYEDEQDEQRQWMKDARKACRAPALQAWLDTFPSMAEGLASPLLPTSLLKMAGLGR